MIGDTLPSGQFFREASDALAGRVSHESAAAVHHRSSAWAVRHDRALCPAHCQSEDGLQVAYALRDAFNAFRREYNEERPHAALQGDPPAARYAASARAFPAVLPPLEYPGYFQVKRVTHAGTIRFKHKLLFLANALQEHHVGLEESADGVWSLHFGAVLLGKIDEATMKVYG